MKSIIIVTIIFFSAGKCFCQTLFYEDAFKVGATASGGSPGIDGFTPSNFEIFIPAGSTIRKAYLFAGRHGSALETEVVLNGTSYIFEDANQVSGDFYSIYGGSAAVHAIDVTADIDPLVMDYTLATLDVVYSAEQLYLDYYLFIAYDNPALDSTFVALYLNEENFDDDADEPWEINLTHPMDTNCVDVALAFMTGYACYMSDGETAYLDGTFIGTWVGNEINSGVCGGPVGSFSYYDGNLTGLMDDDENEVVNETDVIATINNYITPGSTFFEMSFEYADPDIDGESSNAIWLAAIVHGNGFTPVNTILTLSDDALICLGDSINLFAEGDGVISWSPAESLDDATSFNPIAFPDITTVYYVTLDQECFQQTDSIVITVDDFNLNLTDLSICLGQSVEIGVDEEIGVSYLWTPEDFLNNAIISNPVSTPLYSIDYNLFAVNENNCSFEDAITITVFNPELTTSDDETIAYGESTFISATGDGTISWTPFAGLDCDTCFITAAAPLETTTYIAELTDVNGCAVYDSVTVIVINDCDLLTQFPNVFSPNSDGINDIFKMVSNTQLINGTLKIYNRWGEIIYETNNVYEG